MSMIGMLHAVEPGVMQSLLHSDDVDEYEYEKRAVFVVDVHKSWDSLAILLAPEPVAPVARWNPSPLNPMLGGQEFGEDLGYGPPRVLEPSQVQQVCANLEALTDDEIRRRFDPPAFTQADVYGAHWDHANDVSAELDVLNAYIEEVRDFYRRAAGDGLYVVLSIV